MAKLYYQEFQRQMAADPTKKLRVATIFSYRANEEEADGILDEENSEDTSSDKFQNYYKDVSLRMSNLLVSFDEFKGTELITESDLQDNLGRYQDLRDEWKRRCEAGGHP